jgi:hypothetical protein
VLRTEAIRRNEANISYRIQPVRGAHGFRDNYKEIISELSHGTKLKNSREVLCISKSLQILSGGVRIACADEQKSFPTSLII